LEGKPKAEKSKGIVNDRPQGKIPDKGGGFGGRMAAADEVDVKLLEYLDTDGGTPELLPGFLDQGLCDGTLAKSVEIVAVEEDIGIEKSFSGHGLDRG
jgi:hypothetical protein